MTDALVRTSHTPATTIIHTRRVDGRTRRDDGTWREWIWYPTEQQYADWLDTLGSAPDLD